jgi:AcrR family transcriptional regulator
MHAGRPRGFEEQQVLDRAMHLFLLRGYHGLGLSELVQEMGISRQSLHDTFGSKRELFVRAVERYRETQLAEALGLLQRELPPSKSPRELSRALTNAIVGMSVTGRLSIGRSTLGDIYSGTLRMLD